MKRIFSILATLALATLLITSCVKKQVEDYSSIDKYVGSYDFTETVTYTSGRTGTETKTGTLSITKISDDELRLSGILPTVARFNAGNASLAFDPITSDGLDYSYAGGALDAKGKILTINYVARGSQVIDGVKTRVSLEGVITGTKR